jgi:hypothetical protein
LGKGNKEMCECIDLLQKMENLSPGSLRLEKYKFPWKKSHTLS